MSAAPFRLSRSLIHRRAELFCSVAGVCLIALWSAPVHAEEPPWSRVPAWITAGHAAPAVSPEVTQVGLSAGLPGSSSARTSDSLIVGAASYTPPVPEYTGPSHHQPADPAPLPTYSQGWTTSSDLAQRMMPTANAAQIAEAPAYGAPKSALRPPAASEPLWEAGLTTTVLYGSDYPGSAHEHVSVLPLPMIRYRGDVVRSDEKGWLRARAVKTQNVEWDVGIAGPLALHVDSDNSDERKGMPDLDWTAGVGSRFDWTVVRAARLAKVDFSLPVRAAIATDFHSDLSYNGLVSTPELAYYNSSFMDSGVSVKLGLGSTFATEKFQDTYYQVDTPYATASRPVYDAKAGYMGSQLELAVSGKLSPWVSLSGQAKTEFLQGAANENSPLVSEDTSYSVGMALTIALAKSKTQVKADP